MHILACLTGLTAINQTNTTVINPRRSCLQSYSSWVCLCVCVCVCVCPVRFFQTVPNQPRIPTDRLSAAIAWFITCFLFSKTASLWSYRYRVSAVLAHLSAILLALAGARAYIHPFIWRCSRPCGVFVTGFAIVFGVTLYSAHAHLHHWMSTFCTLVLSCLQHRTHRYTVSYTATRTHIYSKIQHT